MSALFIIGSVLPVYNTLQEYFAADGAARLGPDKGASLLSPYLDNPRWQEVILLYCGLADDAEALLKQILHRAQGGDENGWLLAGRCLAEGARRISPQTRQAVADGLLALVRRPVVEEETALKAEESSEAMDLLTRIAPEALADYARRLLASGAPHEALLAARFLPEKADPDLRSKISQRLKDIARNGEAAERRTATTALGWVATADAVTLKTLWAGLESDDPAARAESARALGRLKAGDDPSIAALLCLHAADPADSVRHAALEALLALGQEEKMDMILIPAGSFLMGNQEGKDNEKPVHEVYLPDFYLDRTPVTNAQYRRFIESGGYDRVAYWSEAIAAGRWKEGAYLDYNGKPYTQPYLWNDSEWNSDEQPVVGVSWYEALAYVRWAGKRLPSEAEWEKASGWLPPHVAGTELGHKRLYPWGNAWEEGQANTEEAGHKKTTPVRDYPAGASAYGVLDMAGNVWEWCRSAYKPYPYNPDDGREELGGGDSVIRVLRGGSYYLDRNWARCACRVRGSPWVRGDYWGFRCCYATSSPFSGSEF